MNSIRIDFAPRSMRRAFHRARPLAWMVAFVGLAMCVSAAAISLHLNQGKRTLEKSTEMLRQTLAETDAHKPPPAPPVDETLAAAVNKAIMQLNLPWRNVLDAVEAATPGSIALLSLEPDAKKRRVKGMAEAKSSEAMIAYIENLKRQKFFDEVILTKHEINDQDPNRPLRFQFEAQWEDGQ